MNDEDLAKMLQMGGATSDADIQIARQREQAQQLRGLGANLGRTRGSRIQMAPGLAETIVGAAGAGLAGWKDHQADVAVKDRSANKQAQMVMLLNMLSGKSDPGMGQPTAGNGLMPPRPPSGLQMPQQPMQGVQPQQY